MISTYMRNKVQDFLFSGVSFNPPNVYYIGLSKTQPLENGTGVTEPVGGNYSRIAINRNAIDFKESVNGVVKNKIALHSNESTNNWGILQYFAVFDAPTDGNLLWGGTLEKTRNVDSEMQLLIDIDGISFSLGD